MFDKVLAKTQWYELLKEEIKKPYFISIEDSILEDVNKQITIFPRGKDVFQALSLCAPADTKVVILGQDPYHGVGQANGLAFSVDYGVPLPPSLGNIYKELQADIGCPIPPHGVLRHWAVQGVLLLNTALTVRAHQAASHSQIGWHTFTDAIINLLNERFSNIVFILWGAHAQSKAALIDTRKHCIISAPHPSPLSAYRGFLGSKPFSKANNYLTSCGKNSINWCIPVFPH